MEGTHFMALLVDGEGGGGGGGLIFAQNVYYYNYELSAGGSQGGDCYNLKHETSAMRKAKPIKCWTS